ncbi:hypothetical protein [Nocardia brasiliensis]|uniref:hypothetical protein n=1 Tax=Nocardia brasiliensis TaxID=37326 RepID=UPI002458C870|nr:hypothetical protein [Nocardia brasiliensis]
MRIVTKAELKTLPVGTLFADYHDNHWPDGPESVFLGDIGYIDDFWYFSINTPRNNGSSQLFDRELEMQESGTAYPVDLVCAREGLYDDTTRYLVWEEADVREIVMRSAWFASRQGRWNPTGVFRVRNPDGTTSGPLDEEDARPFACHSGGTIERMYEHHNTEWRAET